MTELHQSLVLVSLVAQPLNRSKIPLGLSRFDTTLLDTFECVELCWACSTSSTQPKYMGSTRRTYRDVTSQVEFWLYRYW